MNKIEIEKRAEYILSKFGEKQIIVAIEEMAELTQALTKYIRIKRCGQPVRKDLNEILANIKEELADVQLMLIQMQLLFDLKDDDLSDIIEEKLERTIKILGCEENA